MKRIFYTFSFIIIFLSSSKAQYYSTGADSAQMFAANGTQNSNKADAAIKYFWDKEGRMMRMLQFARSGNPTYELFFGTKHAYTGHGYRYDNNKIVNDSQLCWSGSLQKYITTILLSNTYNKYGHHTSFRNTDIMGKAINEIDTMLYKYDSKGNMKSRIYLRYNLQSFHYDTIENEIVNAWDSKGFPTDVDYFYRDNSGYNHSHLSGLKWEQGFDGFNDKSFTSGYCDKVVGTKHFPNKYFNSESPYQGLIRMYTSSWDSSSSSYIVTSKSESYTDDKGKYIGFKNFVPNPMHPSDYTLKDAYIDSITYNSDNKITQELIYTFDTTIHDVVLVKRLEYYLPASTSGIEQIVLKRNFISIAPNPANDVLNIKFQSAIKETAHLEIYDLLGKSWKSELIQVGSENTSISLDRIPSGIYILHLQSSGADSNIRFIKQ